MTMKDGGMIKLGYNEEIDKLKTATTEGKNWIIKLEAEEREKTGIKNLKIGYNKVFGYFIEVYKIKFKSSTRKIYKKTNINKCRKIYNRRIKEYRKPSILEQKKKL